MRTGTFVLEGWSGRLVQRVEIVGETRTRYRVRALTDTRLPRRKLRAGDVALIPKHRLTIDPEATA